MGGVRINTDTQVLTPEEKLFLDCMSAGEITGGVHGGNRIGGNAVNDITVLVK